MPDLKHNFSKGRMNKDLDERLVPDGEYRDAENIEIVTAEGSNVGAAQNLLGTTWQKIKTINNAVAGEVASSWTTKFGYDTAKCVGSVVDNKNNSIYWLIVASKSSDTPTNTSFILQYTDKYKIIRPVLIDKNGILNFTNSTNVTGINILPAEGKGAEDDLDNVLLFWTDNVTEPKKINVNVFMSGCTDMNTHTKYTGSKIDTITLGGLSSSDDFQEEHITVIKKSPLRAPKLETFTSTRQTTTGDPAGTGTNPVILQNIDNADPVNTAFARDDDDDGEYENIAIGTSLILTFDRRPEWNDINRLVGLGLFSGKPGDKIKLTSTYEKDGVEYDFYVTLQVGGMHANLSNPEVVAYILNMSLDIADITNGDSLLWEGVLIERDPLYELKFPRFAYRWKYKDNEYSCYSPFTQVAFEASEFDYDTEKGHNLSMTNNIRRIILSDFQDKPVGVDEVEILCKESNNNLIYSVEVLKNDETEIELESDIISQVVDSNQLLRPWDNVPKRALAQEITGNRIIYGNYVQNYTLGVEQEPRILADFLYDSYDDIDDNILTPKKSIKSIRNYQLGVVYRDKYGRETPVFTKSNTAVSIPVANSNTVNSLFCKLGTVPPDWATHYKFLIKDISNEYYNLVMDRYYPSEDGNAWISFPSADRNKVQEGDFLILKKQHDQDEAVTDAKARFKILDIENEVPEYVAMKDSSAANVECKVLSPLSDQPKVDAITVGFQGPSAVENPEFAAGFKEGNKIQFQSISGDAKSRKYEIVEGGLTGSTISGSGTHDSIYSVNFKSAIHVEDEGFARIDFSAAARFECNVLARKREILDEHHGRFFVKIEQNEHFRRNIIDTQPGVDQSYYVAHSQRLRDEAFKYADQQPAVGNSGFQKQSNAKIWGRSSGDKGGIHDSGITFCWRDYHSHKRHSSNKECSSKHNAPGVANPPGGFLNNGSSNFKFFISGYPGGDNNSKKPDQGVNTNGFTAALKKDAVIRFVVGIDGGANDDTIYKSKMYQVIEWNNVAGSTVGGVDRFAERRGFHNGSCPTMAARRRNWNTVEGWNVRFKDFETGKDEFEDMLNLDTVASPGIKQSHWSTGTGSLKLSGGTEFGQFGLNYSEPDISGSSLGNYRNCLGPDFIEILEKKSIEDNETQKSYNPAIFETEPKENIDLELYHEASDNIPLAITTDTAGELIKVGSTISELNPGIVPLISYGIKVVTVNGTTITLDTNVTLSVGQEIKFIREDGGGISGTIANPVTDSQTIVIENTTVGANIYLPWYNCFTYGNGVESNRIRDDYNAPTIDKGPKVSTITAEPYREERRASGLIYSGIFNSTSGTNNTNQFIQGLKITKDINPEYGSIQKLHSRNTDLITLCEDKVIRVLANKDALYNADGNVNLTATENVLGQAVPYVGEFGISKNPESFSDYAFRAYFADKSRGAVLRLSRDGLTNIAEKGMTSYFGLNLPASNLILGSYDEDKQCYNLTHTSTTKGKDITVSFDERVNGWTSFKSYVLERGCSLNNVYYTFQNGDLFSHDNTTRNKFYDVSSNQNDATKNYETSITAVINDAPSTIKQYKTLNYEGTKSREYNYAGTTGGTAYTGLTIERLKELDPTNGKQDNGSNFTVTNTEGWYCNSIITNDQSGHVHEFKEKEGIWFNNIVGDTTSLSNLDSQEFSVQGIDNVSNIVGTRTHGYLTVNLSLTTSGVTDTAELQVATHTYPSTITTSQEYGTTLSGTRTLYITPKSGYILTYDAAVWIPTNPTGVSGTVLSQDGINIKAVITLGGANFVSNGSQTLTVPIVGIAIEKEYTVEGTYDTNLFRVEDLSGNSIANQTDVAWSATGKFGEEKLVIDTTFYADNTNFSGDISNSSGVFRAFFQEKPFYEILNTSLGVHNEPGERYRIVVDHTTHTGRLRYSRFRVYFTFPAENIPILGSQEKFKFTARAVMNYEAEAKIVDWKWGSTNFSTASGIVPSEGDDSRTITVYGGWGAKFKLKQTDPDGVITYLIGSLMGQETMNVYQNQTVAAPIPANLNLTTKIHTYELTGDLLDPFASPNPFFATQYGITGQAFRSSAASGDLNVTAATDVTIKGKAYSESGNTGTIAWTITPDGSIPMKFYGTQPTDGQPLFTNLTTSSSEIAFSDMTLTFNNAKTSLVITTDIDIVKQPSADNISVLDLDSFVKLNEAPISLAQPDVDVANDTVENIILTLTQASAVIQVAEGDTLAYSIVANGSKGTAAVTNAATGACTYTPTNSSSTGADSFTFKANDGHQDSNTSTIAVDIDAGGGSPSYNVSYWEKDTEVANDPYYAFSPTDVTVAVTNFSASDTGNVILNISDMDFNYNNAQGDIPSYVNALGDLTITVVTTGTTKYGDDTSISPTSGTITGGGTSSVNIAGLAFEAQIPNSGTVANGDVLNIKVQIAYDNV